MNEPLTSNPRFIDCKHYWRTEDKSNECPYCQIERLTAREAELERVTDTQAREIERLTAELEARGREVYLLRAQLRKYGLPEEFFRVAQQQALAGAADETTELTVEEDH